MSNTQTITIREALNQALREELERDKDVFIIGEEVGHYHGAYKVTQNLMDQFGEERIVDTPIAESGFAGVGIGAAMLGLKPIVEFMTWNFALVAIDQIINNAAKLRYMSAGQFDLSIVFRGPQGAGGSVAAQHSQVLENFFSYVPGLKVVAPSTVYTSKGLLKSAIRNHDPIIFLESEKLYNLSGEIPIEEYLIPLEKAHVAQEGSDITIITWGVMYHVVKEAMQELENISIELIEPLTLKPIDEDTIIQSVQKTNRVLIVQEGWLHCSTAQDIAHLIMTKAFDYLDAPIEILSAKDVPMPYAFNLEEVSLPSKKEILQTIGKLLK